MIVREPRESQEEGQDDQVKANWPTLWPGCDSMLMAQTRFLILTFSLHFQLNVIRFCRSMSAYVIYP